MARNEQNFPRLTGTEHTVLSELSGLGEAYGLQIVRASKGGLNRASIYVLLSRLEDKRFVESNYVDPEPGAQGPRRRVYRVSGLGQRCLRAWELSQEVMSGVKA